ncbi:MAG: MBL fold metallo-hydrolase [Burkholderiales bacterium]|nr:MBL fold metallo-hydrolase [Burkholderiales bacterium]
MSGHPAAAQLAVEPFFDADSATWSYLLHDASTGDCALIDPVLDFDAASGRCTTASAQRLLDRVAELGARMQWILETHVHADHLSAAAWLRRRTGARIGIGTRVVDVRHAFGKLLADPELGAGELPFDRLFADGDVIQVGRVPLRVWSTPGHTPACVTYVLESGAVQGLAAGAAFVGDTLFMPDCGSARCDFPGGDAHALYRSAQRLLSLPPETQLYFCHDYPPAGRAARFGTTVADQRANNIHLGRARSQDEFVRLRTARDAALALPRLLWPSVQVNARAGDLPAPVSGGGRFLRLPVSLG